MFEFLKGMIEGVSIKLVNNFRRIVYETNRKEDALLLLYADVINKQIQITSQ